MGTHRYSGRVVEKLDQQGIAGLRVEARDCRRRVPDVVATALTDERGDFVLETADEDLERLFGQAPPVLYFQVVDAANDVLASTERTHRWVAARDGSGRIDVVSDQPLGPRLAPSKHSVEGVVGTRHGTTLGAGVDVELYERRIAVGGGVAEHLLATATAANDGSYRMTYDPTGDQTMKPDLVVKAVDGAEVLATNTICSAPARATVDVVIGGAEGDRHPGVPRFADVKARVERVILEPLLDPAPTIADILETSFDFVSCRAQVDRSDLEALVASAQLVASYWEDIPEPFLPLAHEALFGIVTSGIAAADVFTHRLSTLREALLEAVRDRRVAPRFEDEIEDIVDYLEEVSVVELSTNGETGTRELTPIGQLAMLTPQLAANTTKRDAFIRHYLRNEGTTDDFWAAVEADTTNFTEDQVNALKFSADAAALVSFWPAMITKLHDERTALEVTTGRDLTKYEAADWNDFITATGAPPGTTSGDYRQAILDAVERRYRTAFIGARQTGDLGIFFANPVNAAFEFGRKRVSRHIADEGESEALGGITGEPALAIAGLKALERLHKVTSNFSEMQVLSGAGLDSAFKIHKAGKAHLVGLGLSEAQSEAIVSKACGIAWGAMAMYAKHAVAFEPIVFESGILPDKVHSMEDLPEAIPDWETLFGELDQCACEHCRSVLSPSAYLVDVLEFMGRTASGGTNARAELFERRPDIERLMLSCENTNTALPYVDLVNEILEVKVAIDGAAFPAEPTAIQTQRTTPELLAHPEIFYLPEYIAAYTALANGLHPFSMPFHLWAKEARVYLEHLGVPRHVLVEKLAPAEGPDAEAVAIERLDLAPKQYALIAGTLDPAPEPHEPWGFPATPEPSPAFEVQLRGVPMFLERAGLSYDDLVELLSTEHATSAGVAFENAGCVLSALLLNDSVTEAWLGDTHKLLRLKKALGFTISLTSKARTALGTDWGVVTRALGGIKILAEKTGIPAIELLAWFGDIDRAPAPGFVAPAGYKPEPSLFERLFLNKTVLNPDEKALQEIIANGFTDGPLKDRALGLVPGLQISQAEFDLLTDEATALDELVLLSELGTDTASTIGNVSRVFRLVSAARAAQMRVRDFVILRALAGVPALAGDQLPRVGLYEMPGQIRVWRGDRMGTDGSEVEAVFDQTDTAGERTVESETEKPTITMLGGEPAWTFVADSYLLEDLSAAADLSSGSIFMVVQPPASASGPQTLISAGLASDPETEEIAVIDSDVTLVGKRAAVNAMAAVAGTAMHGVLFTWTEAEAKLYVDGSQLGAAGAASVSDVQRFVLGVAADLSSNAATGVKMAECRVGNVGTLSEDQVDELFDYYKARYSTEPVVADEMVDASLRLLDVADRVRVTGAPLDEIHYVLRHVAPQSSGLEPSAQTIAQWLAELETGIENAIGDAAKLDDATGAQLEALAGKLFAAGVKTSLMALANDDPGMVTSARNALIESLSEYFDDVDDAKKQLVDAIPGGAAVPGLLDVGDRSTYLARKLARFDSITAFVSNWMASRFKLPAEAAHSILTSDELTWTSLIDDAPVTYGTFPAIFAFSRQAIETGLPKPTDLDRTHILLRMHKLGLLAARFKWQAADFRAFFPAVAGLPSLDLDALPVSRPINQDNLTVVQEVFATWLRFAELAKLRDAWKPDADAFYAFFAAAADPSPDLDELDATLALALGFPVEDLVLLRQRFGVVSAAGYESETAIVRIVEAIRTLQRIGVDAASGISWAEPSYALPVGTLEAPAGNEYLVASDIKRVAKAKHGEEAWAEIARPLRDVLREQQRATLVDKMLTLSEVEDPTPNDIYRDLLVDVEMSPCQLTSRMVLAHGAVQLFMNRLLMNLEDPLVADEETARQWRWMKTYRVWEANRKVFLWPENWIEPELRDNKTPLFKELESRLRQGPIDLERAEDAYRTYLEGLADIGNLEIVAVHEEQSNLSLTVSEMFEFNHDNRVVHVFGKSRTASKHFYRKRERGEWTPWEKLDIDIDSQHLMPFTLGGRLYLFWPQWSTRGADDVTPTADQNQPEQLGVRLAWSEKRRAGWTAPRFPRPESTQQTSDQPDFLWLGGGADLKFLTFTVGPVGDSIRLDLISQRLPVWGPPFLPYGNYRVARFTLLPGTGQLYAELSNELRAGDVKNVFADLTPPHAVPVYSPSGYPRYQTFRGASQPFKPYMLMPDGDPPARCPVFDQDFDNFTVLAERRREPYKVRTPLFFTSNSRTLVLDHKQRTPGATKASVAKAQGRWSAPEEVEEVDDDGLVVQINSSPNADYYFRTQLFYHPFVSSFRTALAVRSVDGLLRWADQKIPKLQEQLTDIQTQFDPVSANVRMPFPDEIVDFEFAGAYSAYNWELFFHAPLLIATRLSAEGRHEDAQRWFHYIFDPTDGSEDAEEPKRFWKFKPFRDNADLATIQDDLTALSLASAQEMNAWANGEIATPASESLEAQIEVWRQDPFDPHAIARLRISAYQKTVVIKYIENLIAWGDQLFAQDTIESINEATQLYILAAELLGKKPTIIHNPEPTEPKPYGELGALDLFSNAIVEIESIVPSTTVANTTGCADGVMPPELIWGTQYFCVPPNEKLLGLWDLVADRLFKIRHCMNIEGVVRTLPLFQPPIDPALLVLAAFAGIDISSVLNDINVAAPPYRYSILYGKAQDFVGSVIALGSTVLSTLEKQDAEHLSNMRSQHEVAINDMMLETRRTQVEEAKQNLEVLRHSVEAAERRLKYYSGKKLVYPGEQESLQKQDDAHAEAERGEVLRSVAAFVRIIPEITTGFPIAAATLGGAAIAGTLEALATVFSFKANQLTYESGMLDKNEGYKRRKEDWDHQADLAKIEIAQHAREMVAGGIRLQIAQKELATLTQQIEHSREVETFLRTKYTNEDLYVWMSNQLANVYRDAYQLAFEMARRAERAFQYERGDSSQTFITFGHFDSAKSGLLAGEKLAHDLRRMDAAYVAQNKRELELTKLVSLAEHDPKELVKLRASGASEITLTEDDYDRDFTNHYLRRFKSISVTVPCTNGPYQGVLGTLTVLQGETRRTATAADVTAMTGVVQSIVTSQAQMDSGMFELQFRDDRLLPFEGVGAHADTDTQLKFELSEGNRFSYDTIDDLVLDIRYTARAGRIHARSDSPSGTQRTYSRLIRVRDDFPAAWQAFKTSELDTLVLPISLESWLKTRGEDYLVTNGVVGAQLDPWCSESLSLTTPTLTAPDASPLTFGSGSGAHFSLTSTDTADLQQGSWTLNIGDLSQENRDKLRDLWLIVDYKVTV